MVTTAEAYKNSIIFVVDKDKINSLQNAKLTDSLLKDNIKIENIGNYKNVSEHPKIVKLGEGAGEETPTPTTPTETPTATPTTPTDTATPTTETPTVTPTPEPEAAAPVYSEGMDDPTSILGDDANIGDVNNEGVSV
jgi:hypothetical protein